MSGVVVVEEGDGLVAALADALRSRAAFKPLTGDVPVGSLWAYLPRCGPWAAQSGIADVCALSVKGSEGGSTGSDRDTVCVSGWPWTFAQVESLTLNDIATQVEELLHTRYRVSPGWKVKRTEPDDFFGDIPIISIESRAELFSVEFMLAERHERGAGATLGEISAWETFGIGYGTGSEQWIFPVLPNGSHVHPLVAWYAAMYAFSMLARYSPVAWRGHLDLDQSRYAAALQMTLDVALDDVPALVVDALERVDE